ncbi:PucR family transcriptional regulator [Jidongwangia harbinensis]|uniref:PucR family transcriptional regulator n=1 Tax=Jidongwangia harbinensis TaxID=2878561 RepID=UPI001CDA073B|nr:PucR family transcriptional regulator [Jidongwangia harbinensis]MCA2211912.1 helix-turn-helix domain-containing protein [Jidongwangia harbinensis]
MHGDLQRVVDAVAGRVGRAALIEDRHQRVIAYSAHTEPLDAVRRTSILSRHTTPEVAAWFRAAGVHRTRAPMRTPAAPELDLLPRVCLPLLHADMLLGFLWFVDADGSMSDADIRDAETAAADVSRLLHRADLLGDLASEREAEAARTLLAEPPEHRARAAAELLADGVVADDGPVTALVVQPVGERATADPVRAALEHALVLTRRWYGTRSALHLVRRDHGTLLLCGGEAAHRPAASVARHLTAGLRAAVGRVPGVARTVVGLGETYPRLADAACSYRQAVRTARIAARLPALGDVASWASLGVWRLLSMVDEQQVDVPEVHPGLLRLLNADGGRVLAQTLETYLDLAGNAHATAERLRLHRTTLYYRLQRVEQLAGTNLKDGNERLTLHLALKLAQLSGVG